MIGIDQVMFLNKQIFKIPFQITLIFLKNQFLADNDGVQPPHQGSFYPTEKIRIGDTIK